jgi:phosphate starvation-inducible PhoH-like protein
MRGRTLSDAFIILDEAQNTTREQMKMFLTRIGHGTKAVVTGDPSQVDLPGGQRSGLSHALRVLQGLDGIAVCQFSEVDVMRHPLVAAIIGAYDRDARRRAEARATPEAGSALPEAPAAEPSGDPAPDSGAESAAPPVGENGK